jgi:hypothetical protein
MIEFNDLTIAVTDTDVQGCSACSRRVHHFAPAENGPIKRIQIGLQKNIYLCLDCRNRLIAKLMTGYRTPPQAHETRVPVTDRPVYYRTHDGFVLDERGRVVAGDRAAEKPPLGDDPEPVGVGRRVLRATSGADDDTLVVEVGRDKSGIGSDVKRFHVRDTETG